MATSLVLYSDVQTGYISEMASSSLLQGAHHVAQKLRMVILPPPVISWILTGFPCRSEIVILGNFLLVTGCVKPKEMARTRQMDRIFFTLFFCRINLC